MRLSWKAGFVFAALQLFTCTDASPINAVYEPGLSNKTNRKSKHHSRRSPEYDFTTATWSWPTHMNTITKSTLTEIKANKDWTGGFHSYSYSYKIPHRSTKRGADSMELRGQDVSFYRRREESLIRDSPDEPRRRERRKQLKRSQLKARRHADEDRPTSSDEDVSGARRARRSAIVEDDVVDEDVDEATRKLALRGKQKKARILGRLLMSAQSRQDVQRAEPERDDYPDDFDNFAKGLNKEKMNWREYLREDGPSIMELLAINSRHKTGKVRLPRDDDYP